MVLPLDATPKEQPAPETLRQKDRARSEGWKAAISPAPPSTRETRNDPPTEGVSGRADARREISQVP